MLSLFSPLFFAAACAHYTLPDAIRFARVAAATKRCLLLFYAAYATAIRHAVAATPLMPLMRAYAVIIRSSLLHLSLAAFQRHHGTISECFMPLPRAAPAVVTFYHHINIPPNFAAIIFFTSSSDKMLFRDAALADISPGDIYILGYFTMTTNNITEYG